MPARNRMVHRAAVRRSVIADPFDTFGAVPVDHVIYGGRPLGLRWGNLQLLWGTSDLDWGAASDTFLPCYIQGSTETTISGEGKFFAHATYKGWFPLESDLQDEDRLTTIINRRGVQLFADLRVESIVPRESHLEAVLEGYGV